MSVSIMTISITGIIDAAEKVMSTRLTVSTYVADARMPTVPLKAGLIMSRSYSVV